VPVDGGSRDSGFLGNAEVGHRIRTAQPQQPLGGFEQQAASALDLAIGLAHQDNRF
jgi:hypothetical protein